MLRQGGWAFRPIFPRRLGAPLTRRSSGGAVPVALHPRPSRQETVEHGLLHAALARVPPSSAGEGAGARLPLVIGPVTPRLPFAVTSAPVPGWFCNDQVDSFLLARTGTEAPLETGASLGVEPAPAVIDNTAITTPRKLDGP